MRTANYIASNPNSKCFIQLGFWEGGGGLGMYICLGSEKEYMYTFS